MGRRKKEDHELGKRVHFYAHADVVESIDSAVAQSEHKKRSPFINDAIREKIRRQDRSRKDV